MRKEVQVIAKEAFIKKVNKGYPLIEKDALVDGHKLQEEGVIINLVTPKNQFLAKGYYGKQNKGYGWILTKKKSEQIDAAFFARKIQQAISSRHDFYASEDTTAFRIFNSEGDGIGGLIIDYYDGYYVMSWYSEGIYQFKEYVIEALKSAPNFKGLYQKKRFNVKGQYIEEDDFVAGDKGEFPLIVKENGIRFAVYLNDGAMVGVFLDQRDVRKTIRDKYAKGKTVLNMFSYTGAFSVAAALGGAAKTTSVDLANRSLAKTIEQFSVNGIDHEAQDIIVEDVFKYFKYAVKKNMTFDLVVLDPPSFAKSKKHTFSAAKDYKDLLKEAIALTKPNGVIVASTNASNFDMKKFHSFIEKAFNEKGERYKMMEQFALPSDFKTIKEFKSGNYLKVVFIQKINR
ncbi:class I SAM-dependent rRNA methyltransferase [Priestia megaterium]|jgi:23S rRNA (cytosine1962-C5)-methyltransferase|uniref:Class I SAM-dependent rRNA methyltransferase n=1 Tax=Priestia megaterium TaxID=1404 RepID=A0AAE5UE08_PRIMG|nr:MULTISPECIES: class I SAM-dependent rRNA methyltransferase [Priestia]AVX11078.1 class I SAM-dependent rRNA methyltransferase [Bacillus sp. Y-01]KRF47389.1 50S rRNA methyltransferase [Bacillus sp. Soil531]MBZ5481729.1 class I SAM-dependent rRNA methyltransferase [Bacillus sp. T_4]MCF6799095.1 class I SAM-dependent rRNA methyltransferase [Bacillus sp. ET1]MEB2276490.1 class I SAM-dependent rRNA methyltransferase [Bacillus sp. ILBB4]RFB35024.1 class I SAM-dependent rRNA methyltransferase [Bac